MKKKLFAASMSLMLSFVMLVSSSFAWYTINTQAEITEATVTLSGAETIEIAKARYNGKTPAEVTATDAGNQFAFGAIVNYTKESGETRDGLTVPVAYTQGANSAAGTFNTVAYDDTGRTNGTGPALGASGLVRLSTNDTDNGLGYQYYQVMVTPEGGEAKPTGAKGAISYVTFLRTNDVGENATENTKATISAKLTYDQNIQATLIVSDWGTAVDAEPGTKTDTPVTVGTSADSTVGGVTKKQRTDTFQVQKDHIYRVELVLYFNGSTFTAAMAANGAANGAASVVFTNSAITQPATQQNNG